MKRLDELLQKWSRYLDKYHFANPKKEAEQIAAAALNQKFTALYLNRKQLLTQQQIHKIEQWLEQRAARKPLGYIEKKLAFYQTELMINEEVLIPRQETEILVDLISQTLATLDLSGHILVDLCTGSGCIAIALKKRFPALQLVATDICEKALAVARQNARHNQVAICFLQGNLLQPLRLKKIDYLVCNPPYVAEQEWQQLEPEVKNFEPKKALVGGSDGLLYYRQLEQQLQTNPSPLLKIWLEIGHRQQPQVANIFSDAQFSSKKSYFDYSGKERFFFLERQVKKRYSDRQLIGKYV